jgi:hypothetical protein
LLAFQNSRFPTFHYACAIIPADSKNLAALRWKIGKLEGNALLMTIGLRMKSDSYPKARHSGKSGSGADAHV